MKSVDGTKKKMMGKKGGRQSSDNINAVVMRWMHS